MLMPSRLILVKHAQPILDAAVPPARWQLGIEGERQANRLARVLATGTGAPKDMTEAMKWHLIAKAGGNGDPMLDDMFGPLRDDAKAKAEDGARRWFSGKSSK